MHTIESWNVILNETETVAITTESIIMLGCEGTPTTTVYDWMSMQQIETIEDMCIYINGLDFNVQVMG